MKSFISHLSMRWKILLMTTFIAGGLLLTQFVYFQYSSSSYFRNEIRRESDKMTENIQKDMEDTIKQIYEYLTSIYQDTNFMKRMGDGTLTYRDKLYAHDMISDSSLLSQIYALYIYNNSHDLISSFRKSTSLKYPFPYDLYETPSNSSNSLKEYIENDNMKMTVLGYERGDRKRETLRLVLRLYQDRGKRFVGYIVCDMSRRDFDEIIEKNTYKGEQYIWIDTLNEEPINFFDNVDDETDESIRKCQLGNIEENQNFYYFFTKPSKFGFSVHSLSSVSYLEKNLRGLLRNLSGMVLMLMTLWGAIIVVSSRKMTNQLTYMISAIEKIEEGDMDIRLKNLNDDEIGRLGKRFNHMLDEIEKYIYHEYESRIILNDARYYALQSQINPHFLFNTLNTMEGIAKMEGCEKVKNMCEALSNIFRYNIAGNMDKKFVKLSEETEHIKNYLYIVRMRTMDNLKFDVQIDESIEDILIPKLSLQPLVENSISHGLKNKRGEKYISLEAKILEKRAILCVSDNGIGASPERLQEYLENKRKEEGDIHTSIGLRNINERIHILFGEEYGISFSLDELMRVNLTIPVFREGDTNEALQHSDSRG